MALDQIGQKLKNARESHGLSISQIFERTKIPVNHLQSIDNGLADELPEPVYIAGYIKRYADCVGLNGQSLSDEYRKQNGGGNGAKASGSASIPARMMGTPVIVSAPSYGKGLDIRPPNILKQGLWYALLIVMVVGIMAILSYWQSNYALNQTDPTQALLQRKFNPVLTVPNSIPAGSGTATAVDNTIPQPLPSDNDAAVSITASQHVWVEVSSVGSGQSLYTGFMERGERKDYKDPQGLRVHAGNGASISVESQGKTETLGAPGKIAEKVFMSKASATTASTDLKTQAASANATKAMPTVKKPVKRLAASDAPPRRRVRAVDDGAAGTNGASGGIHSSIDVPYRYTESNE